MHSYLFLRARRMSVLAVLFGAIGAVPAARAAAPNVIGLTVLRATTTNLNGAGIRVAMAEWGAESATNWQVNPAYVGRPTSLFAYYSALGSSTSFPNAVGAVSAHANSVGWEFLSSSGVATNTAHMDIYEEHYFSNSIIAASSPPDINARVVNQSFIYGPQSLGTQQAVDSNYDDYAANFNTLFVNGAGNLPNPPKVTAPATCYNGITVGAIFYSTNCSSVGPTPDNGRCKPDLTAPHNATSFTAPQVAGAAAILMQAGIRGDGGADTNSAADIRTTKALLLNGAIKPADWTNGPSAPLDARFGAGTVNVFNSYMQLAGGKQANYLASTNTAGSAHPPNPAATNTIGRLSGWSFATNINTTSPDVVHHYYFNVTNGPATASNATFTATATLVWNRQAGRSLINDLNLFLYRTANSNLVACSTSLVDNVEHLFVRQLPPGRYDLQVLKRGGNSTIRVTADERYALAFEFFNVPLAIARSGTNAVVTWPVYPDGFLLEAATNLNAPVWTTNNLTPTLTNSQKRVIRDSSKGSQFFRLRRP